MEEDGGRRDLNRSLPCDLCVSAFHSVCWEEGLTDRRRKEEKKAEGREEKTKEGFSGKGWEGRKKHGNSQGERDGVEGLCCRDRTHTT